MDDDEDEAPRRAYQKQEDPTLKYAAIVAVVLLLGGGGFFVYTQVDKHNKDVALAEAKAKSDTALREIREFVERNPDDSAIQATRDYIAQREPFVQEATILGEIKRRLAERAQVADLRREFMKDLADVRENASNAARALEIKKKIERLNERAPALGTSIDAERKDLAALQVENAVAILEDRYNQALTLKEKSPDDYPTIARAFTAAEESMTDMAKDLIRSNVPKAQRAKELLGNTRDEADRAAEKWAESEKFGFATVAPINLLDPKEFAKKVGEKADWIPTDRAEWKLDGGKLIARGKGTIDPKAKDIRAGILQWAPDLNPMHHYQLSGRFTVVKKGFTLLARQTIGFQRHEFSLETAAAQVETKAASKLEKDQAAANANNPFNLPAATADRDDSFHVEEGKTYDFTEEVFGKRVRIEVKPLDATEPPQPVSDDVTARAGGVGIRLLPGAEVHFEKLEVRKLD